MMVLGSRGRGIQQVLFAPIAKGLLRLGVAPNAVTIVGTVITTGLALTLLPLGHLVLGSLLLGVMVLTDSVDGIMARLQGSGAPFGAFLDSTLDRVSDAAIFAGVLFWFFLHTRGPWQIVGMGAAVACLAFGAMVSYARAKAESLGVSASIGIAERADRLLVVLLATFATGLGAPAWLMAAVLGLLGVLSLVTVLQRMRAVHRALTVTHG